MKKSLSAILWKTALAVGAVSVGVSVASAAGESKSEGSGSSVSGATTAASPGPRYGAEKATKASEYKVINFDKSGSDLTASSEKDLKSLIDSARAKGEINKVHVAAWSDKMFPKGKAELKDADKELANDRISALENYLKDSLEISNVDSYSMAEKSSWLARAFNTESAELKSMFAQRGAPVTDKDFQTVKKQGGPSKAVVWVEMKKAE